MFVHIHNLRKYPAKEVNPASLWSVMKGHSKEDYKIKHTRHHSLRLMEVNDRIEIDFGIYEQELSELSNLLAQFKCFPKSILERVHLQMMSIKKDGEGPNNPLPYPKSSSCHHECNHVGCHNVHSS